MGLQHSRNIGQQLGALGVAQGAQGFAAGFAGKGKCGRQVQTCGIYTHQRCAQYGV